MTETVFEVRYRALPLRTPYWLSFGPVSAFDTFLVRATSEDGVGYGEITPLPGYSFESAESVRGCLEDLSRAGVFSVSDAIPALRDAAPMVASGIASALDTVALTPDAVFASHVGASIPCVALCGGDSPAEASTRAAALVAAGNTVLKVKIGGDVDGDIARTEAIAAALPSGVAFRVDANQCMTEADAAKFARAVDGMPIELFEQPYKPAWDDRMKALRAVSDVPLMLDESIWSRADIDRAAALGMDYVKLKLCKHPGLAENLALIDHARSLGLRVIYGNGVQGPLGNRQEAYLYLEAGLESAIESNGFAKLETALDGTGLTLEAGRLKLSAGTEPEALFSAADPLFTLTASA